MTIKPGNGSDSASLEYTFKYNPPMDHAVAENLPSDTIGTLGNVLIPEEH